jgi:hypothetical protein
MRRKLLWLREALVSIAWDWRLGSADIRHSIVGAGQKASRLGRQILSDQENIHFPISYMLYIHLSPQAGLRFVNGTKETKCAIFVFRNQQLANAYSQDSVSFLERRA